MRYVVSDVHGEYELFVSLLKKINFSCADEMFICGDIIDKGKSSVRLLDLISSYGNIHSIIGNHEYAFLKLYHSLTERPSVDFDAVLNELKNYFPDDGELLTWEHVDWLDSLPTYIETEDFICVHAGLPLDENSNPLPLKSASAEELVYDRRFKNPDIVHRGEKCVFFGHTETCNICGENKIIGYPKIKDRAPTHVGDFYKIHLDTGAWSKGVLGCFCIDSLSAVYVKK